VHPSISCDIEGLTYSCAQHLDQVGGMRAQQCGAIAGDLIGNPAAAGHAIS
jgi:hypothetical protein